MANAFYPIADAGGDLLAVIREELRFFFTSYLSENFYIGIYSMFKVKYNFL